MTRRHALIITPAPAEDARTDFSATFASVDPSAPALSIGELSTQRGDGIFESIGVVDGHPQDLEPHLDRLLHSASLCDLPEPHRVQWHQAVAAIAREAGPGESVIKLILSRGIEHGPTPTAWVTLAPAPDNSAARTNGLRVVTLDRGIDSGAAARAPWLLLGAKTLSYAPNMAAIREAKRRGADDALFVSSDGVVLEAPTASVLLRYADEFVTPEPGAGILHGTTQLSAFAWLAEQGFPVEYRTVTVDELARTDGAWFLSSVRLAAAVTQIDGVDVPTDPGLTDRLNSHLLEPRD